MLYVCTHLTEDHGSIVCTSCGLEICASTVDTGLNGEARSFKEDEDEFADSRVGGTFDPLLPVEQQMGTFMQSAPGCRSSAIARICHSMNRPSHTQVGLRVVEARCNMLRLSTDAIELARKMLHAVLEPPAPICVLCGANPQKSTIQVALCGHAICASCEQSGMWFAQQKHCKACSQPMRLRPHRLNVNSTHAAVIYLAAKATPGSTRTVAEVTAGLNLTNRQFSDGLRRVKAAAGGNLWLEQVMLRLARCTDLPQLCELLSRRLASLKVDWSTRCAAVAALERIGGFVAGHKGVTVVTAIIMLTLQHLGDSEETALQQAYSVGPEAKNTIRTVAKKLQSDKRFDLGLPADSTPPRMAHVATITVAEQVSVDTWLGSSTAAATSQAVSTALPLPLPQAQEVAKGLPLPKLSSQQKRKRDSPLACEMESEQSLPLLPATVCTDTAESRDALPEGWERFFDDDSRQWYYHHATSGTTQWSLPTAPCAKRPRRIRAPREQVTAHILRLFHSGGSYTLPELVRELDQPKAYVKEILTNGIGEYNRKDCTWRFKQQATQIGQDHE